MVQFRIHLQMYGAVVDQTTWGSRAFPRPIYLVSLTAPNVTLTNDGPSIWKMTQCDDP